MAFFKLCYMNAYLFFLLESFIWSFLGLAVGFSMVSVPSESRPVAVMVVVGFLNFRFFL